MRVRLEVQPNLCRRLEETGAGAPDRISTIWWFAIRKLSNGPTGDWGSCNGEPEKAARLVTASHHTRHSLVPVADDVFDLELKCWEVGVNGGEIAFETRTIWREPWGRRVEDKIWRHNVVECSRCRRSEAPRSPRCRNPDDAHHVARAIGAATDASPNTGGCPRSAIAVRIVRADASRLSATPRGMFSLSCTTEIAASGALSHRWSDPTPWSQHAPSLPAANLEDALFLPASGRWGTKENPYAWEGGGSVSVNRWR